MSFHTVPHNAYNGWLCYNLFHDMNLRSQSLPYHRRLPVGGYWHLFRLWDPARGLVWSHHAGLYLVASLLVSSVMDSLCGHLTSFIHHTQVCTAWVCEIRCRPASLTGLLVPGVPKVTRWVFLSILPAPTLNPHCPPRQHSGLDQGPALWSENGQIEGSIALVFTWHFSFRDLGGICLFRYNVDDTTAIPGLWMDLVKSHWQEQAAGHGILWETGFPVSF